MTWTNLQVDVLNSKHLKLADGEKGEPDADAVPQRSHHGVPQHRAHVLEEWPGGHEVAAVQDDRREHVEEEDVGAEHGGGLLFDRVHDAAHDEADADEEAGLRDPDGDLLVDVETWTDQMMIRRLRWKDSKEQKPQGSDDLKLTNFGKGGQQNPQCELKGDLDPRVVHGEHGEVGALLAGEGLRLIVERFDGGDAGRRRSFGLLSLTFPSQAAEQEQQNHR